MVVKRFTSLGLVGRGQESEEEEMGRTEEDEGDIITDNLGHIGRYQVLVGLLFALMEVPHAWCMLMHKFVSVPVDHWCTQPEALAHWSVEEWRNYSSPPGDSCNLYLHNRTLGPTAAAAHLGGLGDSTPLEACSSWQYDTSQFQNTIIENWDLVCANKIMSKVGSFTFFAGTGVGVFIAGLLADKIGRQRTICIFLTLFIAAGFASAFAPSMEVWMAARFFWGAASLGLRSVKMVSALELVGSSWRAIICVGFVEGGWTLGYLTLPLLSWILPNAFHLQLAVAVAFLPVLPLMLVVSESPKWLSATGRLDQCRAVMARIMRINGISKELVIHETKGDSEAAKGNFFDLFRTPMMRRNTFVISLAWFALGTLYFGLSLHMPQFDANIYVIFFLSGLVEIPADIIPFVLLNRFGRRPNLSLHYIIGGLLCMATAAVPLGVYSYEWPIVVLAMLGKYVAQVCWGIVYLYTSELFPTVIRSVALSFACSMARIGSMAAPFIAYLAELHPVLPIFVFGSITFVVGLTTILLPETNKKKLPDTLEEGESFLRVNNPLDCCL